MLASTDGSICLLIQFTKLNYSNQSSQQSQRSIIAIWQPLGTSRPLTLQKYALSRRHSVISRINGEAKGGPSGWYTAIICKHCSNQLASPAIIFNKCIENNYIPLDWLQTCIAPIFKRGFTADPHNYRPIALTRTMCKVVETKIKE